MTADGFTSPFATYLWKDVGSAIAEDLATYTEGVRLIPSDDLTVLSTMLKWTMTCYQGTLIDYKDENEVKNLYVIAPVLHAVGQLVPGLSVDVNENVDGIHVDCHAYFDFVIKSGNRKVCVVQAKGEIFNNAVVQALLGCEVVAHRDDCHEVYAVVTNAQKWIFLRSLDENVSIDEFNTLTFLADGGANLAEMALVTGKLYSMLAPSK
ncbi:TPA: hypothetical protein N0F65_006970 [Lagenidium giganteum]|uniref:Uncharacterized protein n=1 Tax=Lagenidium giganteum TaxID=4803 RepID=A0AAV2ZKK1_9STRA|nr:TPA: hypothetical protein N0F65_006970 [Lagenidium giganteum]